MVEEKEKIELLTKAEFALIMELLYEEYIGGGDPDELVYNLIRDKLSNLTEE